MEYKYSCPHNNCKKRYNSEFWFKWHLNQHKPLMKILDVVVIIIALILFLIPYYLCPNYHLFCLGDLKIDFNEDYIIVNEDKQYTKIEIVNELGYTLEYPIGTAIFTCEGGEYKNPESFVLEGGDKFLPSGDNRDYLISPDPLLVNLVDTRDYGCSDVNIEYAHYIKYNKTHSKLDDVYYFEIFTDDGFEINKVDYNYPDEYVSRNCISCSILINITASNTDKTFLYPETQKFVGGTAILKPFSEFVLNMDIHPGGFYLSRTQRLLSLETCSGLSRDECTGLLCNKIYDEYKFPIDCDLFSSSGIYVYPPFTDRVITPP